MSRNKTILCATLGSCVHVAGIFNFMRLAQQQNYKTEFLRPPNTISEIIQKVHQTNADIIGLSYRLTPEVAVDIIKELKQKLTPDLKSKVWIFGGTTSVCEAIIPLGVFSHYFNGEVTEFDVLGFLRHSKILAKEEYSFPDTMIERIDFVKPYPLLRAHFGMSSVDETLKGIEAISQAKVIDVISIGPDQNFQEHFFSPKDMKKLEEGAGGVPIRSEDDLTRFYVASRQGNFPLLRCYSGTRDLVKMAKLLNRTIHNAWGATPLFWYSELDGRSSRKLPEAIEENQDNMAWYGSHKIPFESNESHHWSLRSAPDAIAVTASFLGAYNAKKAGVEYYISQLMMDTPLNISPRFDLAKMMAKTELIEGLHDSNFTSFRQTRTGLLSFPEDPHLAKGQLASSLQIAMFLNPHIVHVVSFCEANHMATSQDVIESTKIARRVISNSIRGIPSIIYDRQIQAHKQQLIVDANYILQAINLIANQDTADPLTDPLTLSTTVKIGILDAPHLRGSTAARGEIETTILDGKCLSIDKNTLRITSERDRLNCILEREGFPYLEDDWPERVQKKAFTT